ncbi:glycosyltransferase [Nodosilinea sp. LEGE 07088]|uniref:glycosyltransferase n=1 Tax=Nodosilinea sp. LEGE 07088 TaxID=2777968 RepID=UPI001882B716|nr:glycosyltransferase [Nodosilinea sp. LEGE 07088]MBE9135942.1 glycosyltransferase [Nodosilinea sp. LEGE 07088]
MYILLVIPAIGDVYGGPTKIVVGLAEALSHQGMYVDVVTTNANGQQRLEVPIKKWVNQNGYRIKYFPYFSSGDYKWSSSLAFWLFNHVHDYNVVHSNAVFSLPNIPVHLACQWHKTPYVMAPHGMLEPWALSYKPWKKHLYYKVLERPALNRASVIQATASPESEHIRKLGLAPPIVTIPNGIHEHDFNTLPDAELFYQKFPLTRNKTLILFLGRIDPKKGLDLLAQAFASIQLQFPQTHLIIAGPDNIGFSPTAQEYFAAAGCSDSVTFTGFLTGALKYAAFSASNLYVAPSYSEGFSMSILEAMASGLPCIITTGCNFPEAAIAKAAYVVESKAEEITEALLSCLSHPAAAERTGNLARKFILEHYTWEKVAKRLIETYQSISPSFDVENT